VDATDAVLELNAVTKAFGSVTAVDRLTRRFERGEYFCILGPSGCGKTTLLRLIAGFERPDAGSIHLHGGDVSHMPPERRDVNVVFQSYALFPHLTVRDNVSFGLRMKRLPHAEIRHRVDDAIDLVHLATEASRLPRQLSGGQQQRVALARALVNRPAVLLLDEPLSALDQSLRQRMQSELRRIQRETGVTFLHITHDQGEALSLADRVAVMRAGRFVQVATPREVYRRPASPFVASFVGATNLLHGRVADRDTVLLSDGSPLTVMTLPPGIVPGAEVTVAIRPEALRFDVPRAPAGPARTLLRGRIEHVTFAGAALEYGIVLDAGPRIRVVAASDGAPAAAEGENVALWADPDEVVVLPREDA
jgi:spermidine/putrescine transport system ATP-binding protein